MADPHTTITLWNAEVDSRAAFSVHAVCGASRDCGPFTLVVKDDVPEVGVVHVRGPVADTCIRIVFGGLVHVCASALDLILRVLQTLLPIYYMG